MAAPGDLHFPIKLRCGDPSELLTNPKLEMAIANALGRSFARARASLPPTIAFGDGVLLQPARMTANSFGASVLTPNQWKILLERVNRAVEIAARAQSIPLTSRVQTQAPAPRPVSEPFDAERYAALDGSYEVPSYDGGKKKVPVRRKIDPFKELLKLYDPAISDIEELAAVATVVSNPNVTRTNAVNGLVSVIQALKDEAFAVDLIARVHRGEVDPDKITEQDRQVLLPEVREFLTKDGQPNAETIADAERQLRHWLALTPVIRASVTELDGQVKALAQGYLREATMDVGSYYLEAERLSDEDSAERIAFLGTFYSDPTRIALYAVLRWARKEYDDNLVPNVNPIHNAITGPQNRARLTALDRADKIGRLLHGHYYFTGPLIQAKGDDVFGDLPRSQSDVRTVPEPGAAAEISAEILQLQVELPVLILWEEVENLRSMIGGDPYPGSPSDREGWETRLGALRDQFSDELGRRDHPGLVDKAEAWQSEVEDLRDTIHRAIRRAKMIRTIIEQVLLMIVGGGLATRVGTWVARAVSASKWVVAISEAATITLFNGVMMPSTRPDTVLGWGVQFGENVLLIRLGQLVGALGEGGRKVVGATVSMRRLVLTAAATLTANSLIQTAVQAIDARVKGVGGESGFTDMLSLTFVTNVIGSIFAAAIGPKRGGMTQEAFDALPQTEQMAELKRSWGIAEDNARRWLTLRQRTAEFQRNFNRIAAATRKGAFSPGEFEAWRTEALELARDLAGNLDLIEAVGGNRHRQDVAAVLDWLIAAQTNLQNSAGIRPVPELIAGLTRVGEGPGYVYDPTRTPLERLKALRNTYAQAPGVTVSDLPGGGWEATDANGKVLFQAIPAAPKVAVALPQSLDVVAAAGAPVDDPALSLGDFGHGPKAQEGLARVRAQKAAPELEAQLAQLAQTNRNSVVRLLQLLARGDAIKDNGVWRGVSVYLKAGGKLRTLVRMASLEGDRSGRSAATIFRQLAEWGPEQVRVLETIYRIRPHTTATDISILINEVPDVKSILRDIDAVAPASDPSGLRTLIGQLFVEVRAPKRAPPKGAASERKFISPAQTGAKGTLAFAATLPERFPGKRIVFESPGFTPRGVLRIEDIVLVDPDTGERFLGFELKEVTSAFLGKRAPGQLAADIARDAHARDEIQAAGGKDPGPYHSFRWAIRRFEIEAEVVRQLREKAVASPSPGQIDDQMRAQVRDSLRAAFDDPNIQEMQALSAEAKAEYRAIFDEHLSFVEFF